MMELVTPTIRQGGVNTVFVMVSGHLYWDGSKPCVELYLIHSIAQPCATDHDR